MMLWMPCSFARGKGNDGAFADAFKFDIPLMDSAQPAAKP